MKKKLSRQRLWQIRRKEQGICASCQERIFRGRFCERHYWAEIVRRRKRGREETGSKPWRKGGRGRPPLKIPVGMA